MDVRIVKTCVSRLKYLLLPSLTRLKQRNRRICSLDPHSDVTSREPGPLPGSRQSSNGDGRVIRELYWADVTSSELFNPQFEHGEKQPEHWPFRDEETHRIFQMRMTEETNLAAAVR